tara:strand:+ start:948 stop:1712 length:765 start_codon:yes stop_codon:yes gene_type:complete
MYSTLYTFGCSFTQYKWPTWADYLHVGGLAENYQNWGLPGGSNDFIFHSVVECLDNITDSDIVCIMWSQPHRISDYNDEQGWDMPGNAYLYQPKERVKYLHEDKIALENQSFFRSVAEMLASKGCDFYFTSMERINIKYEDVFCTQQYFKPSMAEFLGYTGANETTWRETLPGDKHPSPREHAEFSKTMFALNNAEIDNLCSKAELHIFQDAHPWRRQYIYMPEKTPKRLPRIAGKFTTGNGVLADVAQLRTKS